MSCFPKGLLVRRLEYHRRELPLPRIRGNPSGEGCPRVTASRSSQDFGFRQRRSAPCGQEPSNREGTTSSLKHLPIAVAGYFHGRIARTVGVTPAELACLPCCLRKRFMGVRASRSPHSLTWRVITQALSFSAGATKSSGDPLKV